MGNDEKREKPFTEFHFVGEHLPGRQRNSRAATMLNEHQLVALKRNPGKWAQLPFTYTKAAQATSARSALQQYFCGKLGESLEFASRSPRGRTDEYCIYVRYVVPPVEVVVAP